MGEGLHPPAKPPICQAEVCSPGKGSTSPPCLKKEIKRESAASRKPRGKCPRPLFLISAVQWKGARPLAGSQRGLLYSALEEQESSPNNKVALVRCGGAFMPGPTAVCRQPWCGVGGTFSVSSACCPARALRLN